MTATDFFILFPRDMAIQQYLDRLELEQLGLRFMLDFGYETAAKELGAMNGEPMVYGVEGVYKFRPTYEIDLPKALACQRCGVSFARTNRTQKRCAPCQKIAKEIGMLKANEKRKKQRATGR